MALLLCLCAATAQTLPNGVSTGLLCNLWPTDGKWNFDALRAGLDDLAYFGFGVREPSPVD